MGSGTAVLPSCAHVWTLPVFTSQCLLTQV